MMLKRIVSFLPLLSDSYIIINEVQRILTILLSKASKVNVSSLSSYSCTPTAVAKVGNSLVFQLQ